VDRPVAAGTAHGVGEPDFDLVRGKRRETAAEPRPPTPDCSKLEPLNERRSKLQLACASMSQNNLLQNSVIYAGLDVHKATLQLQLAGGAHELPNDAAGHRRLVRLLAGIGQPVQVVCEASGGYERAPVAALLRTAAARRCERLPLLSTRRMEGLTSFFDLYVAACL